MSSHYSYSNLIFLLLFSIAGISPSFAEDLKGFDIQAHRGGRGRRPENTIAAFRYAIELGVSTIEMDLAVTRDRVVVVSHDPYLSGKLVKDSDGRFLPDKEKIFIKDLSLEELKTFFVGEINPSSAYYSSYREQQPFPGERIPTLEEVFNLVREMNNHEVKLNLEIKTYPPFPEYTIEYREFVRLVLETVSRNTMEERVILQSFDWRTLAYARELNPKLKTVCLAGNNLSFNGEKFNLQSGRKGASPWLAGFDFDDYNNNLAALVKDFGADIVAPYYREITKKDVEEAHRMGLKIIPWTVNQEWDMRRLINWGVDGIITDYPDVLKELVSGLGLINQ